MTDETNSSRLSKVPDVAHCVIVTRSWSRTETNLETSLLLLDSHCLMSNAHKRKREANILKSNSEVLLLRIKTADRINCHGDKLIVI